MHKAFLLHSSFLISRIPSVTKGIKHCGIVAANRDLTQYGLRLRNDLAHIIKIVQEGTSKSMFKKNLDN